MIAKLSFAFLTGMVTDVIILWFADARTTPAAFSIGCLFVIGFLAVLALSSPARMIRAAAVLNAIGTALEEKPSRRPERRPQPAPAPVAAPVAPEPEPEPPADPRIEELASALRHIGATKKVAEASARQAIAAEPTGDFQSLFKLALTAAKVAA